MAAPSKAEQIAEATNRANGGPAPGETAQALEALSIADDGAPLDPGGGPPRATPGDGDTVRPLPPARGQFDDRRADIVARFRTDRNAAADDQRDDISEFTRSGMPPEFAQPNAAVIDEPAPDAGLDDDGADAIVADAPPRKHKLIVRGQNVELTDEELIAKAQIALAGDSYLDEARTKLNEVNELHRSVTNRAPRAAPDGEHPAAPQHAQTAEPGAIEGDDPQHPEDPFAKLIETLQFGDPGEAKSLLQNTIAGESKLAVRSALEQVRLEDEGARTAKVLKDFEGQHPELAQDKKARAAIESEVLDIQIADIKALGVDPAQLRPDGLPPTAGDIAVAHRWYRAKGFKVTPPGEMLETATANFLEWRGIKPNEPAVVSQQGQPHVDLTIDRSTRRATVPQQPSRAAAPRQNTQQPPPAPRDRSAIVQSMIAKRAAPRGKVGV